MTTALPRPAASIKPVRATYPTAATAIWADMLKLPLDKASDSVGIATMLIDGRL